MMVKPMPKRDKMLFLCNELRVMRNWSKGCEIVGEMIVSKALWGEQKPSQYSNIHSWNIGILLLHAASPNFPYKTPLRRTDFSCSFPRAFCNSNISYAYQLNTKTTTTATTMRSPALTSATLFQWTHLSRAGRRVSSTLPPELSYKKFFIFSLFFLI